MAIESVSVLIVSSPPFLSVRANSLGLFRFQPVVTLGFQLQGQLFAATSDNSPFRHDMNKIWHDVIQKPLVMCDQQNSDSRSANGVDPFRNHFESIDIQPAIGF